MRILIISGSRSLCRLIKQCLRIHALGAEVVLEEAALAAADAPVLIYHAPDWDAAASRRVQRLRERTEDILVVSRDALRPLGRLSIASSGALDGFSDDQASVRLLALQAQRVLARRRDSRLELGPLVLDTEEGLIRSGELRQALTLGEVRLLTVLWTTAGSPRGAGLTGQQLAELAHLRESSVRNRVEYLRDKLASLTGGLVTIAHQRGTGYRLVGQGQPGDGSGER